MTTNALHRRVDFTTQTDNNATDQCSVVTINTGVESLQV